MDNNSFSKMWTCLTSLLLYKPPRMGKRFVLSEKEAPEPSQLFDLSNLSGQLNALLRYAYRLAARMEEAQMIVRRKFDSETIQALKQKVSLLEKEKTELAPVLLAYDNDEDPELRVVSASLETNQITIRRLFRLPDNEDIVIRRFTVPLKPPCEAILVFAKGLVDSKDITSSVLMPLFNVKDAGAMQGNVLQLLASQFLPNDLAELVGDFRAVINGIQRGYTALFVDGAAGAVLLDTKGFERRAVGRPQIEQTIRGNQSAFTETLQTNIALIRLLLRSRDLVTETVVLGKRSQTDCAVMYLQSVVNPALVSEVKRRLTNISADNIAAGMLEQFIEDHPWMPMPQTLSTERPDRVSSHLAEGRIAILLDGDPFVLVAPISVFTLFHSPEDSALKVPIGTFMRFLRWAGAFVAAIFPALYLAITYYHPETLPTDLALAIAGARERIPFPAIIEVAVMELSFELIREAGTRKPGLLGETIGIVGGIILGQAVVAANLISPITVVVIAITGLASFAIPDFRTGMAVRMVRFLYIVAALLLGLIGLSSTLFVVTVILCSIKSFGVPYLSPVAPKTGSGFDVILRGAIYRQEMRPDELNTLDGRRQPPISRKWDQVKPEGGRDGEV